MNLHTCLLIFHSPSLHASFIRQHIHWLTSVLSASRTVPDTVNEVWWMWKMVRLMCCGSLWVIRSEKEGLEALQNANDIEWTPVSFLNMGQFTMDTHQKESTLPPTSAMLFIKRPKLPGHSSVLNSNSWREWTSSHLNQHLPLPNILVSSSEPFGYIIHH